MKEAGHSDEEANVYSEGAHRGGTLVSVKAHDDEIATVEGILNTRRGVDATASRRGLPSGRTAFDPAATPYSADEIGRERTLYDENRSFTPGSADDVVIDDDVRRTDRPAIDPSRREY